MVKSIYTLRVYIHLYPADSPLAETVLGLTQDGVQFQAVGHAPDQVRRQGHG